MRHRADTSSWPVPGVAGIACKVPSRRSWAQRRPSASPTPPTNYADGMEGWLDRYSKRIERETGYRLEHFPASLCPPRDNRLWIACIRMEGPADHVVVARRHYVVHDPSDLFTGLLPLDRLIDGMVVVPARRVVPVFSPVAKGHAVVAA